jgi:hypothetical protein
MAKPVAPVPKKPYSAPKLVVYGTVRELTQTVGTSGHPDGGKKPKSHGIKTQF